MSDTIIQDDFYSKNKLMDNVHTSSLPSATEFEQ